MDEIQKQITKTALAKMQKNQFTPKQIAENKLKAFSIGAMGKKGLSRTEEEKRRKKEEEEKITEVFKEFNDHFDNKPKNKINQTWIKAGTFDAGSRKEDSAGKGQLYKPTSKLAELAETFNTKKAAEEAAKRASELAARPDKPGVKKQKEKKKSQLEIFKEELKAIQEERDERNKYKQMLKAGGAPIPGKSVVDIPPGGNIADMIADVGGDPTSTNLYLGNLSPRLTESALADMFGKFGPLASVKIMYPRTEDEKNRGKHCGFVAYMSRRDGERALAALVGKNIDGFEMRLGWGKPVPIPLQPIYIPPALLKYTTPPPPTGLPFNCQPDPRDKDKWGLAAGNIKVPSDPKQLKKYEKMLARATVKVVIPSDRSILSLINRLIEFVIREGPIFEATIMNQEMNNPQFKFLFENNSPEHVYYRWRLYSLLQGDTKDKWSTSSFRMFSGGSLWKPPVPNIFTSGMPEELLDEQGALRDPKDEVEVKPRDSRDERPEKPEKKEKGPPPPGKRALSDKQRDHLEEMLRSLLPDRNAIAEAMVWCIEHAESSEEVIDCLAESLSILETPTVKKIARLFLISDILHNCTVKGVANVSFYRTGFQVKMIEISTDLNKTYKNIPARMKAEAFKQRVMACFRAWEDWALYPMDFLIKLQNIFLGLVNTEPEQQEEEEEEDIRRPSVDDKEKTGDDSDEDVDGVPLDGAALLKAGGNRASGQDSEDSLDGEPLPKEEPVKPTPPAPPKSGGFVTSKWETVDPEDVKAGAMTTSKWEVEETDQLVKARKALMGSVASKWDDKEDVDGEPINNESDNDFPDVDTRVTEERRQLLREIEVKVMQYQDELEGGKKGIKSGWTISEQVEHYRKKLLRRAQEKQEAAEEEEETQERSERSERSSRSDRDKDRSSKKKKRRRSRSESSSRSRSRDKEKDKKSRRRRRTRSGSSSPERDSRKREKSRDRRSRSRSKSSRRHSKRSRSRSRSPRKHKKKRH